MIAYKKPEITVINPANYCNPICNHKDPICYRKPDWTFTLDDIESQYSKSFMHMKIIKTLRKTVEKLLGRDSEKYREKLPTVMKNLYDMEW